MRALMFDCVRRRNPERLPVLFPRASWLKPIVCGGRKPGSDRPSGVVGNKVVTAAAAMTNERLATMTKKSPTTTTMQTGAINRIESVTELWPWWRTADSVRRTDGSAERGMKQTYAVNCLFTI